MIMCYPVLYLQLRHLLLFFNLAFVKIESKKAAHGSQMTLA